MINEQAKFALDLLTAGFDEEMRTARRVIEAIPEDKCDFRPERRVRSAFEMAWHLVSSEIWFLEGILAGQFSPEEPRMPAQVKSIHDILDYYDRNAPALVRQVREMKPEELARPVDFFGMPPKPAVLYLPLLTVHSVHHRAQLALYLRMMGLKVPSIYGGSLDEPFQSAGA
ncbi:MAG TPA: DinB family protein [Bryobacteraceae bacterium]|nr:DinB family protein [Bryobacteraceae bacterium]